jgi:hypothetical protein
MMTDREQYTPGPASGAQVRKDGEKWTRRSSVQICPPQPFNSLIHKGLPTRGNPFFFRFGRIWAQNFTQLLRNPFHHLRSRSANRFPTSALDHYALCAAFGPLAEHRADP